MHVETGPGWEMRLGRWQDSPLTETDVIISDPPYDEKTHRNRRRGMVLPYRGGKDQGKRRLGFSIADPIKSFDPINPADVGPPLVAIAKRWVILFCAVEQLGRYQDACGKTYLRSGLWVKRNPTPQFTGDRPGQWGDAIAILHRAGRKRWHGGGHTVVCNDHQVGQNNRAGEFGERYHETQKPLLLMTKLVRLFSDPGELIWDPYAGSATTGVACLRLGRKFIGHEMQQKYFDVAVERLRAENHGLSLRDARAGQTALF